MSNKLRTAIVTGAAQGIGKSIAQLFVSKSIQVVACDINEQTGKAFENEIADTKKLLFVKTDVSNEDSAIANQTQYGCKLQDLSLAQWQTYMNVNINSLFLCCKYALSYLQAHQHQTSIVNISSTRGLYSEANTEAYSTTKSAVYGFTHALANSVGPQVRFNCISPGWIHTVPLEPYESLSEAAHKQHPVGRVGKPEDIAALVWFLCDAQQSGFITGQNLVCDGGMITKMKYEE